MTNFGRYFDKNIVISHPEIDDDGNERGTDDSCNGHNDTNTYICPEGRREARSVAWSSLTITNNSVLNDSSTSMWTLNSSLCKDR